MNADQWKQVKEIFSEAVELPLTERLSFIEQQSGGDALIIKEVHALLESDEEAEDFIENPAAAVSHLVRDETALAGKKIGFYEIEREIGRGGMGAVYLAARADEHFTKRVAIKLIKRGFDTDDIIRRFRHERQILAALDHPNITRLLDGGATEDGLPYLVMDYVEGLPLTRYCEENNLSVNERLKLFLQICSAMIYAHQNLIIHRDIKPSNILITKDGVPKLLDFGIAKLTAPDSPQTLERHSTQMMTPEYASPEQILGQTVTTAADIYSLGVVLYELLTRRRPFKIESNNPIEISKIITDSAPVKPSSIVTRNRKVGSHWQAAISTQLKGDLDNIILMAMRKEPERRYSSVEQFAADINRYLKGLPVIAREDSFNYRAAKFVGRHKAAVAAGAGIVAALIGGLATTKRQAKIARRQRDKAENINRFLQKMLNSADPRVVGKDVKVTEVLGIAAESLKTDFADEPEIIADLQTTIGLTFLSQGKSDLAEPHLRRALDTRLELFGREHYESAISLYNFGQLLQARGDAAAAETCYRQSLKTLRRLVGNEHLEISNVLHYLAYVTELQGKYAEAIQILREELKIRRALLDENHPSIAHALSELGSVLTITGDADAAEPLQRQALAVMRRYYGDEHPDTALVLVNLFGAIQHKNPVEAELLVVEALRIRRKILGDSHPDVAWTLYHLSFLKINKGEAAEAERLTREILNFRGTTLTDENLLVSNTLLMLGRSLMAQSRLTEAETIFRECLALRQKNLSSEHWLIATTNGFLGECLMLLNRTESGMPLITESYASLKGKLGENHEQTRNALKRVEKFEQLGKLSVCTYGV